MDVKKLTRVPDDGRRVHGAGELHLHVLMGDHSRTCYAEERSDERGGMVVAFLGRDHSFLSGINVEMRELTTDNGPAYRSRELAH